MSVWNDLLSAYKQVRTVSDELRAASVAQWILESGRGTSRLATEHLNFGGLKFRTRMVGYAVPVNYAGSDGETTAYCKFSSAAAFIQGYWHFITSVSAPYQDWKTYEDDPEGYIKYISGAGFNPSADYPARVISLLNEARNLLSGAGEQVEGEQQAGVTGKAPRPQWTELRARYLNTRTTPILGIVLHDTAGSGTHNDTRYLADPQDGRPVSVDFTVERSGAIFKLNPDLKAYYCNHAGRSTAWHGFKNKQVNSVTIGIEIVQRAQLFDPPYTTAQVDAVAALCAWIDGEFGVPNSNITTHRQIITDGSRSDPRRFPFEEFWTAYWRASGKDGAFVASLDGTAEDPPVVAQVDQDDVTDAA